MSAARPARIDPQRLGAEARSLAPDTAPDDALAVPGAPAWMLRHVSHPWSMNTERNGSWHVRHSLVREWRQAFGVLARQRGIPPLQRAHIVAQPCGVRQDPGNCFPAVKAAVDGLLDAGVLPDDNGKHVASLTFLPPIPGTPALMLYVVPV